MNIIQIELIGDWLGYDSNQIDAINLILLDGTATDEVDRMYDRQEGESLAEARKVKGMHDFIMDVADKEYPY